MINEIILAIIQSITEFLPISSSGHLTLISKLISKPDLFFFTLLHLASLLAVLIFLRKEIFELIFHPNKNKKIWFYWIIATIPAALFGYLLSDIVEKAFSSYLLLGICFIFTGVILHLTKYAKYSSKSSSISLKSSILIGLAQILALFPGVSRSGITISSGLFLGIDKEKITRFSFLLFIPLSLGAFVLELVKIPNPTSYLNLTYIISFVLCSIFSLCSLQILSLIIKREKFWIFSFYCWLIGLICLIISF